jgi:rRNA small subunit pseudouridine methyltransferase Nep1
MGKKLEDYRPDVTHQSLLALMDSPLNMAGLLQVYIRTANNMLIEVSPHLRVPRTFKNFCGLMAQTLTKLRTRAATGSNTLLNVIKNPFTDHIPLGIKIVGTSSKAENISIGNFVARESAPDNSKNGALRYKSICYVIGAVSVGNPGQENEFVTDSVCIASQGLSAACICAKITNAYEEHWQVV